MKILFILSGNTTNSKVLIKNPKIQGESLAKLGYDVEFFYIKGKGLFGYLKAIPRLRKLVKEREYDILHAHYSFSAFVASFCGNEKLVVSLMGSDIHRNVLIRFIIKCFCWFYWHNIIVKTDKMKDLLNSQKIIVLPNGVDLEMFKPIPKDEAKKFLNLSHAKIILFVADPVRPEKNFQLAQKAFDVLNDSSVVLLTVHNIAHNLIPYYINASEMVLLTSLWEGSVNVVKEAMACNVPVVSTDVGDVRSNTQNQSGYYITSFDPIEIAQAIRQALDNKLVIDGVSRIKNLNLDTTSVNRRLISIYKSILRGDG